MNVRITAAGLLALCVSCDTARAGIGGSLEKFFHSMGAATNTNAPGAFKDQNAGYWTLGGFSARNGAMNAQLATVNGPGFKGGCGGIDAWAGSFSFINSQALVNLGRNIAANAASYAVQLGVQTVAPQIYTLLNELNALATLVNNRTINSCEAAATLLGGMLPKSDQARQMLCKSMGSNLGFLSDWAQGQQDCNSKAQDQVRARKDGDPRYKDILVGEFNLAWKAIQKNAFLSKDRELAELFMTVTGTIISASATADEARVTYLPSRGDRDTLINGVLNGGAVEIYRCDSTEKCLHPVAQNISFPAGKALLERTRQMLHDIGALKRDPDGEYTKEHIDFINSCRLPVEKMLTVATAYKRGMAPVDIDAYAEVIAVGIVYRYILEIIEIIEDSAAQIKSVQIDDTYIEKFMKNLREVRARVIAHRHGVFSELRNAFAFMKANQLMESQLHLMLGTDEEF